MKKESLTVPNISSWHCVSAIKNRLGGMAGVLSVIGNADTRKIEVEWESPATIESIKNFIKEMNYPAQ